MGKLSREGAYKIGRAFFELKVKDGQKIHFFFLVLSESDNKTADKMSSLSL